MSGGRNDELAVLIRSHGVATQGWMATAGAAGSQFENAQMQRADHDHLVHLPIGNRPAGVGAHCIDRVQATRSKPKDGNLVSGDGVGAALTHGKLVERPHDDLLWLLEGGHRTGT
jgi:hypothetical protein